MTDSQPSFLSELARYSGIGPVNDSVVKADRLTLPPELTGPSRLVLRNINWTSRDEVVSLGKFIPESGCSKTIEFF